VAFRVDGQMVESAAPGEGVLWHLEPGEHVLEVSASLADGRVVTAESEFEVRP
jgi:hypothetical protein